MDIVNATPSDFQRAINNYPKTGKIELLPKERWQIIIRLKNEGYTNQEIADIVGLKTGQQVANELTKIRKDEIKKGVKWLTSSSAPTPYRNELALIDKYLQNPINPRDELAAVLFTVYYSAHNNLPFETVATRLGYTQTQFNVLWKELSEAGFQKDGTLWLGMQLPQTRDQFDPEDEETKHVLSYMAWLANHPDQLPSIEINMFYAIRDVVQALAAIAIDRAKVGQMDVLNTFKFYTIPKEHKNKENSEAALLTLQKHWYVQENR